MKEWMKVKKKLNEWLWINKKWKSEWMNEVKKNDWIK